MRDDYDEIKQVGVNEIDYSCNGKRTPDVPISGCCNTSPSPVMFMVSEEHFKKITACLRECAEDLEAELKDRYPDLSYPSEARRFARDMEPVERAFELLGGK